MGIMAMKLKSSGLEGLGLRIDNRKRIPGPARERSSRQERRTDYQEREWPEGRAFPAARGVGSSGARALWGNLHNL